MTFSLLSIFLSLLPTGKHYDSSLLKGHAERITTTIQYNNIRVDVVIDKPANDSVDVLIAYHGTTYYDNKILAAANTTLDKVKKMTARTDMMIVSVAYPEEGKLMGDNLVESEAALLWVKEKANKELGVYVKKIFLIGHSQGGYIVTRLNTMYATNGLIANGPGPLNLALRCTLEENNSIKSNETCSLLKKAYGSATKNETAYLSRSLLNFTNHFKSDILFVQGLNDKNIQLKSWQVFKQRVMGCKTCKNTQFLELENYGHTALFDSPEAKQAFNNFINRSSD